MSTMERAQIEDILRASKEKGASDVHLTAGSPPVFRINGALTSFGTDKMKPVIIEGFVRSLITEEMFLQLKQDRDIDFSFGVTGVARYRVNCFYQRGTLSMAFRTIPTEVPTFDKLNLPPVLKRFLTKPHGLILVTGPTGSGKSTTLAAMINEINQTMYKRIITLEDPIEYLHSHNKSLIDQREIGIDAPRFSTGLRSALRQDPDVILLGEMRDLETISTAVTAAETGHLVFATVHTSTAASTVSRIIDVFPAEQQDQIRAQLANVLAGVVSQRLMPRSDGTGRVAALEIMVETPAVSNLIRTGKEYQIQSVLQTGKQYGMQTMQMALQDLVSRGLIPASAATPYISG
ncbi:type IV pilus twitching motility protein PilT [Exiguobacterium artemiae]|uniref:type IV pilus twitching motility protein PilT n=1 Tax=Exiguobacterium sp. S22-S28 TaxID=3342768 RepID=UPI0011CAB1DC